MAAKVAATETSDVHQLVRMAGVVYPYNLQVVVGSGGVGKSCLTIRFLKDEFSNEYDPTIGKEYRLWLTLNAEENYRKSIMVDNVNATVNIIDTAGQQEYTALRDQHLKDGKGFLLVFAMNDRNTFEEVQQLREQIIKLKDTKRVPIVICGNKCVRIRHTRYKYSRIFPLK